VLFFVFLGVAFMTIQAIKHQKNNKRIFGTVMVISGVVAVQIVLGVVTVLSAKQVYMTSFHVVTGAALLGLCVLLTLRSMPLHFKKS